MAKINRTRSVWHPLLWPSWLLVMVLYGLSQLPMPAKQRLGARLGKLAKAGAPARSKVALQNIQACFPELNAQQQQQLVEDTYVASARGFLETIHAWWGDVTPYVDNLTVTGRAHLREAQSRGQGILLIGGHYSIYDFALPLIAHQVDTPGYMYRPNDNPVIDRMIEKGRRRHCGIQGFSKREIRDMIAYLQRGGEVWYACDQDFGRRRCELFVPFFGMPAGCITTPSWIARESGASVLCVSHLRHPDGQYEIAFSPIQEGFGQDARQDAEAWNGFLEASIRQHPDQYLWLHKRFKTRPKGTSSIYRS